MTAPAGRPDGPPPLVLVVSDLHLAGGRDPRTGRYDPRENFFADEAFGRLLRHHDPAGEGGALLVLNGDVFDFLRVVDVPEGEDVPVWQTSLRGLGREMTVGALAASITRKERRFGLRTNDYKSVWKVDRIARGHPGFFRALGWWAARGGTMVFVKGNHDLELHWPLVQAALRREIIRGAGAQLPAERVQFAEEQYRLRNFHVEHGHEVEPATRVRPPDPELPGGAELRLPLGSFVNRYIINKLETIEPFLDNIKPVQRLLWTLVRRHPWTVGKILWYGIPFVRRAARPYFFRQSLGFLLFLGSLVIPLLTVALVALVFFVPAVREWIVGAIGNPWVRRVLSVAGVAAPWLVGSIRDLVLFLRPRPSAGEDHYGAYMHRVLRSVDAGPAATIYGVAGHSHRMDVQALGRIGGAEALYLNSGSWAPTWRRNRPDLSGRVIYSFIAFTWTGEEYRHACREWRDDRGAAGEPVDATVLREQA